MRFVRPKGSPASENTIPLINIVFLLLVFFLLAGTLEARPPFTVAPVETSVLPPADLPQGMLYVSADGRLFMAGRGEITLDGLPGAVRAARDSGAPQEVLLDRNLPAKALFPIIEALSKADITAVRLMTQRLETE